MLNQVTLIGRLSTDPKVIGSDNKNNDVVAINLAVERDYLDANGDRPVDYLDIVYYGKNAETIKNHLTKGRLIASTSKIYKKTKNYELFLKGETFKFLDGKKDSNGNGKAKAAAKSATTAPPRDIDMNDDFDVPF